LRKPFITKSQNFTKITKADSDVYMEQSMEYVCQNSNVIVMI